MIEPRSLVPGESRIAAGRSPAPIDGCLQLV
jgi:hypothetical protein